MTARASATLDASDRLLVVAEQLAEEHGIGVVELLHSTVMAHLAPLVEARLVRFDEPCIRRATRVLAEVGAVVSAAKRGLS